ncbi:hypothetical protein [Pseudobutyrivibrio xylanivorans]|uniref:Chromosome partitioning protein ParA n=1 Tax=Pseudobutyrivibrio xylanivorans TaxID=185007 RepID=A0A5P6VS97_PSEXY|nr:hypothetical protein [Pseudobutyrivibrio xylanivorans]QFJ55282.1 hypothetical protein FXF36_10610 [Pseudobutyrivibrio xylanivorans]
MDEKKIIEESTESKEITDTPVDLNASTETSAMTDENGLNDGGVTEEKSYKARVEELLKWQMKLADEQAKLEAYRTSTFQQMGELEQQKRIASSEQQAALQEERQKFEADLASIRAKKDAETIAMIAGEWSKFEKEKEAQIIALKKELEGMRTQTQKEMDALRSQVSKELDEARSLAAKEIQVMKSEAQKEIDKAQADSKKEIIAAKQESIKAAEIEIEQRTRELTEAEKRTEREAGRLAELDKKLQQLEIELEAREAQVNDDKSDNIRERRRLDREKQRINGASDNLEQEIQERFSDRIDSYERKLDSKDDELERLRSELASLMATSESIQSLRAAYGMDPEKIKARIADLEARNKALLDEAANSTTRIEYDRVSSEKRALETKFAQAQEEIRRISVTDGEVQTLRSEIRRLESTNENLKVEAEEARNIQKSLQNELLRLSTPAERELDREARIASIKREIMSPEELEWETHPVDMNEIDWLEDIKKQCDNYGIKFQRRILYAFHTALKINDWSIITVLAGVSGTGKSELPKLYSFFGGLNFISVAVQPNWDSQESMLGFFNSIDNQFQPEDLLSFLVQCSDKDSGFKLYPSVVLLDEMNLAYVEHYFAEFLSKLEERRGKTKKDLPEVKVNLGAGVAPYELPLVRNVLWTGTMNQDETTKSLSDKVIDRSMVINFPRPKHLAERTKMEKLKKTEKKLLYDTWRSWITVDLESDFTSEQREIFKEYKRIIEKINDCLEEVGRALGHRVWQSIEYYIANYPTVINALKNSQGEVTEELKAEMRTAFEDQLVQKVMPKLRGIETRGKGRQSLQNIEDLLAEEGFENLKDDFEIACEQGYGQFVWSSAKYLGDDEDILSSDDNAEKDTENNSEE